jgi:hypothetical protein
LISALLAPLLFLSLRHALAMALQSRNLLLVETDICSPLGLGTIDAAHRRLHQCLLPIPDGQLCQVLLKLLILAARRAILRVILLRVHIITPANHPAFSIAHVYTRESKSVAGKTSRSPRRNPNALCIRFIILI